MKGYIPNIMRENVSSIRLPRYTLGILAGAGLLGILTACDSVVGAGGSVARTGGDILGGIAGIIPPAASGLWHFLTKSGLPGHATLGAIAGLGVALWNVKEGRPGKFSERMIGGASILAATSYIATHPQETMNFWQSIVEGKSLWGYAELGAIIGVFTRVARHAHHDQSSGVGFNYESLINILKSAWHGASAGVLLGLSRMILGGIPVPGNEALAPVLPMASVINALHHATKPNSSNQFNPQVIPAEPAEQAEP